MTQKIRNRAKGFTHGGPRKGLPYQMERVRVATQHIPELGRSLPLSAVAVRLLIAPRNLYFRLRRHKIPYVLGPKDGRPGRQVWIPESSLERIAALVWKSRGWYRVTAPHS